jgi:dTDP-4-amino-4,6-dideoxygalactose transaminase
MYDEAFSSMPELITPLRDISDGSRHARHLYTLLLDLESLPFDRNGFVDEMKKQNIGTGVHFTALHLHKYYHETFGYTSADCPNASWIGERTASLPLSGKMTDADVADVIRAVKRVIGATKRGSHRRSAGV